MQKFIEREKGVFVSDKIIYSEDGKNICKVLVDQELDISPEWPLTLYRFMPFSRLYTELEKECLTFLSPKLWKDPFESAFLELGNGIDLKCLCFTHNGSIGEEWAWKAYGNDEQLIRVELLFYNLVKSLSYITNKSGYKIQFYICVCDYSKDKKTLLHDKTTLKKSKKSINLEGLLNLMNYKRKTFASEKEIRIFAVDSNSGNKDTITFAGVKYKSFVSCVLLEPLNPYQDELRKAHYDKLQAIHNDGIKTYLQKMGIKTHQSHLYETK